MEKIVTSFISNQLSKKKNEEQSIYDKKESELNTEDRLAIITANKYEENDFGNLMQIYKNREKDCDYNENIFNDLELFYDNEFKEDCAIFQKLDFTSTVFGKIIKKRILEYPIHQREVLIERQNVIKKLVKHNNLQTIVDNLNNISKTENDLIWFWKYCNTSHMDVLCNYVYFDVTNFMNINQKLNKNELLLNLTNYYNIFLLPLMTILSPLMTIIAPVVLMYMFKRRVGINLSLFQMIKLVFNSVFKSALFGNGKKKSVSIISIAVWIIFYLQNCNNAIKSAKNNLKIITIMQQKISSLLNLVNNTKSIFKTFNCNLNAFYIDYDVEKSLNNLDYLLNHQVFQCENKLLNNKGKILKNFKIVNMIKNEFVQIMKYVGLVDFCVSNKKLLDNGFNFSMFIKDSEKPIIQGTEISHPYLENSVKNDVNLNGENMIITGPNAAGKSTFIKTVILNVLLGQTIGICKASSFKFTIFYNMETYLHIPDKNGISSLFETEMLKSKNYIDKIVTYPKDKKSLIIMDEIFSSTNYIEGASGAYGILKKLSTFKNNMTLITTHYSKLCKLQKVTKNSFQNYKFEIERNEKNEIIYNYKISKGISNQNIALELLKKNNFDESIIKDAVNFERMLLKTKKKKKLSLKNI